MNIQINVRTVDEWFAALDELRRTVRAWRLPVRFGGGITPSTGSGTFMAHFYPHGGTDGIRSYVIRTTDIDPTAVYTCREMSDEFLDEGMLVSVSEGTMISHLFHRGPHPDHPSEPGGTSFINFAVRMTDEEAMMVQLSGEMQDHFLKRVNGPYHEALVYPNIVFLPPDTVQ